MRGVDQQEITARFSEHPPSDERVAAAHKRIRLLGYDLTMELNSIVPESRELSLAITHIENAVMWANKGLARTQGYGPDA